MIDLSLVFDGTFAANGAPTGAAITATRVSTNVIDLTVARDIGIGDDIEVHCQIVTAFSTGDTNAATLQVDLETCSTAGGSYDIIMLSPVYAKANLIVGAKLFAYKLPRSQLNSLAAIGGQFLRLNYTCTGAAFTAGRVVAYLTGMGDRQSTPVYPANYTVGA